MFCFFKCTFEKTDSINSDGSINPEKMTENVNKWKPLTNDAQTTMKECLKNLEPIKTCSDILQSYNCIYKGLEKMVRFFG